MKTRYKATINKARMLQLAQMKKGIRSVNALSVASMIGGKSNFQDLMNGQHTPDIGTLLQVLDVGLGMNADEIVDEIGKLLVIEDAPELEAQK